MGVPTLMSQDIAAAEVATQACGPHPKRHRCITGQVVCVLSLVKGALNSSFLCLFLELCQIFYFYFYFATYCKSINRDGRLSITVGELYFKKYSSIVCSLR